MNIESAAKALRELKAFEKKREKARQKVLESFDARWQAKRTKVLRDLDDETRAAVLANLGDGITMGDPEPAEEATNQRPAWLDEQPPESPPAVVVERKGKK